MIIKSHIRGGFRDAAAYLKEQGKNEVTRLAEISDPHAQSLDEAFRAMWAIADGTKVKKALHHISINPMKDERLTDKQVDRICARLQERYGYARGAHQRVIVEHVKDGRQHFHVIWNRVSMQTGKPHWPYMHKKQSKIVAREMEIELGLKKPVPRSATRPSFSCTRTGKAYRQYVGYQSQTFSKQPSLPKMPRLLLARQPVRPFLPIKQRKRKYWETDAAFGMLPLISRRPEDQAAELLAWAWENKRFDILYQFGIILPPDYFEP